MKVLGLIEQDLDIVSKEYVDKKLKEISKSGAEAPDAPEGYVRLDIPTLLIALPSESAPEYQTVGVDYLTLIGMFISQSMEVGREYLKNTAYQVSLKKNWKRLWKKILWYMFLKANLKVGWKC